YSSGGLIGILTNELGLVLNATWDNLLRLTNLSLPDSTYISRIYDKLDVSATRDRLGNWNYFGHDGLQHLTAITNANQAITRLGWCGCGSLEAVTNALNQATTVLYDQQLRLTTIQFPDGSSITYQYNLAGQVTNILDGANRFLRLSYNNQGLITTVS